MKHEEDGVYKRLVLTHMAYMVQVNHLAKVRETAITPLTTNAIPDEMIRHE